MATPKLPEIPVTPAVAMPVEAPSSPEPELDSRVQSAPSVEAKIVELPATPAVATSPDIPSIPEPYSLPVASTPKPKLVELPVVPSVPEQTTVPTLPTLGSS